MTSTSTFRKEPRRPISRATGFGLVMRRHARSILLATFVAAFLMGQVPAASAQAVPPAPENPHYFRGYLAWTNEGRILWGQEGEKLSGGPGSNWVKERSAPTVDVFKSDPLPKTIHINVSRSLLVFLYMKPGCWAGYPSPSIELYLGDEFLAGTRGGVTNPSGANDAPRGESVSGYCFSDPAYPPGGGMRMHAEIATLPAGSILSIRLIHAHVPLSSDTYNSALPTNGEPYEYGFRGKSASRVLIPYYPDYELAYRLGTPESGSSGEGSNASVGPVMAASAALAATLPRRKPRRAIAAMALVIGLAFAGCVQPGASNTAGPASRTAGGHANVTVEPVGPGPSGEVELGSIAGRVRNPFDQAIASARVSILTTSLYASTNIGGRFNIENVPSGTYGYRVEANDYHVFQSTLVVRGGNLTRVDVTLEPLDPRAGDFAPHRHNLWPASNEKTVLETTFFRQDNYYNTGPFGTFTLCPSSSCTYELDLANHPDRPTILPGAREVEVTVTWTGLSNVEMAGVEYRDASGSGSVMYMYPRGSGLPTRIQTNWEMTDSGHAKYTSWGFKITLYHNRNSPHAYEIALDSFTVKIVQRKGVLPLEPGHVDWWAGSQTFVSLPGKSLLMYCGFSGSAGCSFAGSDCNAASCAYSRRHDTLGGYATWKPQFVIPADTVWLECVLREEKDRPSPDWGLMYRPGNLPMPLDSDRDLSRYKEMVAPKVDGDTRTFLQPLPATDSDPVYATISTMRFLPVELDAGSPPGFYNYVSASDTSNTWILNLTVIAHRDAFPGDAPT